MRVYLPNLAPNADAVGRWRELAVAAGHELADRAVDADLTVFVEAHLLGGHPLLPAVARHPAWQQAPGRCFVYDERDLPLGHLPGAYVSLPTARHGAGRFACAYYSGGVLPSPEPTAPPQLLFSFLGSRSHPVRAPLLELSDPRAVIEDTTGFVFYESSQPDFAARQHRFDQVMWDSKFVLCPRGRGSSSIRSYETLQRGRVPVIIADDWVAPVGPDWDTVSLRVREDEVGSIPRLLNEAEPRWEAMSAAARAAYDAHFRPARVVADVLTRLEGLVPVAPVKTGRAATFAAVAGYWHSSGRETAARAAKRVLHKH